MTKKIVMILNSLNKSNGGKAARLDLINNVFNQLPAEYEFNVGLTSAGFMNPLRDQTFFYLLKTKTKFKVTYDRSKIKKTTSLRQILSALDSFFYRAASQDIENLIIDAHIVIICTFDTPLIEKTRFANPNATIITFQNSDTSTAIYSLQRSKKLEDFEKAYSEYERTCLKLDYILTESEGIKDDFQNFFPDMKTKAVHTRTGIDENEVRRFKYAVSPYRHDIINIVCIGSIQRRKNQLDAIKSFKKIQEKFNSTAKLHIVGAVYDQNYADEIKRYIELNNMKEHVRIHGYKTDYLRYIKHANLVLHTALAEGFPRSFREAFYYGIPTCAYELAGFQEYFPQNSPSLLVKKGDWIRLSSVAMIVLTLTQQQRRELSSKLRLNFESTFSRSAQREDWNKIFERIRWLD